MKLHVLSLLLVVAVVTTTPIADRSRRGTLEDMAKRLTLLFKDIRFLADYVKSTNNCSTLINFGIDSMLTGIGATEKSLYDSNGNVIPTLSQLTPFVKWHEHLFDEWKTVSNIQGNATWISILADSMNETLTTGKLRASISSHSPNPYPLEDRTREALRMIKELRHILPLYKVKSNCDPKADEINNAILESKKVLQGDGVTHDLINKHKMKLDKLSEAILGALIG